MSKLFGKMFRRKSDGSIRSKDEFDKFLMDNYINDGTIQQGSNKNKLTIEVENVSGRRCVLKTLKSNNPSLESQAYRIIAKYQDCYALTVRMFFYVNIPNLNIIITEYLSPEDNWYTLDKFIQMKQGEEYDKNYIVKKILETILKLNSICIYHMDICPNNILINKDTLQIKFIDFDQVVIGKDGRDETRLPVETCKSIFGTVGYTGSEAKPPHYTNEIAPYNISKYQSFQFACVVFEIFECIKPFDNSNQLICFKTRERKHVESKHFELMDLVARTNPNRPPIDQIKSWYFDRKPENQQ